MNLQEKIQKFQKVIEHTNQNMASVRTNRATPALVEEIKVDVFGSKMPIKQIASISSPEIKQLLIEPWDKTVLKNIEKAIETVSLGLIVKNEGNFLRISIPTMTDETRQEIIKLLHEKIEAGRILLRNLRDKIKEEIIKEAKAKEISEDEKYSLIEDLDKMTKEYNDKITEIGNKKETEITL